MDLIDTKNHWPSDYIEHIFKYTNCGQHFRLAVETYHGNGDVWEPITFELG